MKLLTYIKRLKNSKKWAALNYHDFDENNDNGEWELSGDDGCNFNEMCNAVIKVFENIDNKCANDKLIDSLLYAIARDNEDEILAEELIKYPGWFCISIKKSIETVYINAMWQLVKRLPECKNCDRRLIFRFLESDDEYTSRMALQVLPEIFPEKAEEYAIKVWNNNKYKTGSYEDEYQKIMSLFVLNKIKSSKLKEYLDMALKSDYKYLSEKSKKLDGFFDFKGSDELNG